MGFSSVDDLVSEITGGKSRKAFFQKVSVNSGAGTAGRFYDLFLATGMPAAGAYSGAAGSWNSLTSASAGAMDIGSNVTPDTRHITAVGAMTTAATGIGGIWVLDYLGYHPSMVVTGTASTISAPTLPRYATGDGVQVMIVTQTAIGAATPSLTFTYTNQAGTTGRVATAVTAIANSAPTTQLWGTSGPFLPLAAGDTGVRALQSYTLATGTTGTVAAVYVKPLAFIPVPVVNVMSERDMLFQLANLPQVQDGACLGLMVQAGGALAASSAFQGYVDLAWG